MSMYLVGFSRGVRDAEVVMLKRVPQPPSDRRA
jgi:hypothetical protein